MDFQQYILDTLLDKYEASRHYQGKAKINRRVTMSFKQNKFPQYWEADKPYLKAAIHQVVDDLVKQGIISVKWLPFEKGNIIELVSFNLDQLTTAYRLAQRIPKEDEISILATDLGKLEQKISLGWVRQFIGDCLTELQTKKNVPSLLPKEQEERKLLFKILLGLEEIQGNQILERVFSLKYLGDSKVFQKKMKKKLTKIAGQYLCPNSDWSEDDILAELGINKTSEEVLVYGPIGFSYQGREIDYTPFPFGGIVDTRFSQDMDIHFLDFKKVITIENKANFHFLVGKGVPKDYLLIYIGGFPGPQKRNLLAKIYTYQKSNHLNIAFYHWGDIDVGGFRIFHTLEEVVPTLQPLFMDKDTLLKYRTYCDEIEENYARRILKLLDKVEYARFGETLKVMLEEKIRLEQEALLTNEDFLKTVVSASI